MNKIIVTGRLVNDVDLKVSEKGVMFFNNSIAVKRDYKNQEGNYDSDFFNIVAFNSTAKYLGDYASKGDYILIEGTLGTRNYVNREGNKVYVTEISVQRSEILKKVNKTTQEETNVVVEDTTAIDFNDIDPADLPF